MHGAGICFYVHKEAAIFNVIDRVMFKAGHHVVKLYTFNQGSTHLTEMTRIFTIGFLGSTPSRMAKQVDAHPGKKICALGAGLFANHIANAAFKHPIETGPAGHRNRETG